MRPERRRRRTPRVNTDTWSRRRRWMVTILVWMMANAQFLIIFGRDTALHQNALVALLSGVVAILGSYVFGAVWDDHNRRAYDPPVTTDPPYEGDE